MNDTSKKILIKATRWMVVGFCIEMYKIDKTAIMDYCWKWNVTTPLDIIIESLTSSTLYIFV